jgi:hypothetical protein
LRNIEIVHLVGFIVKVLSVYITYTSQRKSNFMKVDVYFEIKLLIFEKNSKYFRFNYTIYNAHCMLMYTVHKTKFAVLLLPCGSTPAVAHCGTAYNTLYRNI